MRDNDFVLPENERQPVPQQGVDYSPKSYSLSGQIFLGVKIAAVTGFISIAIWLLDKFSA